MTSGGNFSNFKEETKASETTPMASQCFRLLDVVWVICLWLFCVEKVALGWMKKIKKKKKNRQTPKGYLGDLLLCVNAHNIFKETSLNLSLKLFLNLVMSSVSFSIHFFVSFWGFLNCQCDPPHTHTKKNLNVANMIQIKTHISKLIFNLFFYLSKRSVNNPSGNCLLRY